MTGMPEAGLAREAGLAYAHCCLCANRAAGLGDGPIEMDAIEGDLVAAAADARRVLGCLLD